MEEDEVGTMKFEKGCSKAIEDREEKNLIEVDEVIVVHTSTCRSHNVSNPCMAVKISMLHLIAKF